jgi:TP901 family phage tail tape measure protein
MADRLVRIMVSADTATAIRNLGELGVQSGALADKSDASMARMASGGGGALTKLGQTLGNWGVPFSSSLTNVGKKFDAADSSASKFGALMPIIGVAAVGALAGITVGVVDLADKFDKATNKIAASAGISQGAAKAIGDNFLNTAGTTIYSGTAISNAYAGVAAQLGATQGHALNAGQAMTVMRAAMDGAQATGGSLNSVTSTLANTMQIFHLKASAAASTMNILYEAGQISGQGIDGVSASMVKMHAQLGAATPPLGQVAGLLDDLKLHGESGKAGLSAVSTGMTALIKNSEPVVGKMTAAQAALRTVGVSAFGSQGQLLPFSNIVGQLAPKLDSMTLANGKANTAAQMQALTAVFGASANKKLLDTILGGPVAYDAATAAVTRAGTAHAAAQKAVANMGDQMKIVTTAVVDLGTKIGEKLMPPISTVVTGATNFTEALIQNKPALIGVGVVVGTLAVGLTAMMAVLLATKIATMAQAAASSVATLATGVWNGITTAATGLQWLFNAALDANPIALVILAIVGIIAVGVLLITHWKLVVSIAETVWHDVSGFFTNLWGDITSGVSGMIGSVVSFFSGLEGKITGVFSGAATWLFDIGKAIIEGLVNGVKSAIGDITSAIGNVVSIVKKIPVIGGLFGSPSPYFTTIGEAIGQGLTNGLKTSLGGVTSATAGLVATAQSSGIGAAGAPGVPGASGASSQGAGGGTIINNITNNIVSNNPQELVNQLKIYNQQRGSIPIRIST